MNLLSLLKRWLWIISLSNRSTRVLFIDIYVSDYVQSTCLMSYLFVSIVFKALKVLRISNFTSVCSVFANVEVGWKNVGNGQTKTWHQSMNLLTISLIYTSRWRLFGCSRLDNRDHWLDNLCDTFDNHSQKHICIHLVSCSLPWMPVVLLTYFCTVFFKKNHILNV